MPFILLSDLGHFAHRFLPLPLRSNWPPLLGTAYSAFLNQHISMRLLASFRWILRRLVARCSLDLDGSASFADAVLNVWCQSDLRFPSYLTEMGGHVEWKAA